MTSLADRYKETVKDYNFGSLIRTDAGDEYSEKNTIFSEHLSSTFPLGLGLCLRHLLTDALLRTATRIQFYAYEIARNRLGLNAKAHEIAIKEAEKERLEKEKREKAAAKGKAKANGHNGKS